MRKRENSTEITALKWTAAGLSITIALLVGLLAFLIRQQAGAYSPPTERSTEEISVTEGVGTETDTGAVTVPVAHAAGQSATDAPTVADPPPTSEPDTETDPETATGQTGIWQTEIRVSVGLTFADNPDGTCTVTGLGDCTDACLILPPVSPGGRVVSAIGARAFAGSDIPVTVYIPATVTACLLHGGGWTDRLPGSGRRAVQFGYDAPALLSACPRCRNADPARYAGAYRGRRVPGGFCAARDPFCRNCGRFLTPVHREREQHSVCRWRDLLRGNEKLTRCGYTVKRHIPCGTGCAFLPRSPRPSAGYRAAGHASAARMPPAVINLSLFPLSIDTSAPVWYTVNKKGT